MLVFVNQAEGWTPMPMSLRATNQHFINIQQQSISILFQFILSEFLLVFESSQKIENWMGKIAKVDSGFSGGTATLARYRVIYDLMHELTGSNLAFSLALPWNSSPGSLRNLCYYTYLYHRRQDRNDPEMRNLAGTTEKAFRLASRAHAELTAEDFHCGISQDLLEAVCPRLNQLSLQIDRISSAVAKNILKFAEDENVLFFVLRNQHVFNALYAPHFVRGIFDRLFSHLDEAEEFLIKRYVQRGFDNLIPIISDKIRHLQQ